MFDKRLVPAVLIAGLIVVGGSSIAWAEYQSYGSVVCQNLGAVGGQTRGTGAHTHAHLDTYLWGANWSYDSANRTRTANSPFDRVFESTLAATSMASAFRYCTN